MTHVVIALYIKPRRLFLSPPLIIQPSQKGKTDRILVRVRLAVVAMDLSHNSSIEQPHPLVPSLSISAGFAVRKLGLRWHSLQDQIEAEKNHAYKKALKTKNRGLRFI